MSNLHACVAAQDLIWKYLTEVCLGLYVLHTNRILHRDIKAANIFVGENDCIKVRMGLRILLFGILHTLELC